MYISQFTEGSMDTNLSTRLNKYISESGICSRREADRYIEQGLVLINGKRAGIGDQVFAGDEVKVNGRLIEAQDNSELVLIALNKPVGIVSTTDDGEKDNIVDYVNHSTRIFPIGRLDKDSQGLIFLTNHGDLVNKILRAGNDHEKEYLVTVNKPITDEFIHGMGAGVPIMGQKTKKCKVKKEAPMVFRITLVQGLNRQIRRMCEYFGYEVTKLERIRIMNVSLSGLKNRLLKRHQNQSKISRKNKLVVMRKHWVFIFLKQKPKKRKIIPVSVLFSLVVKRKNVNIIYKNVIKTKKHLKGCFLFVLFKTNYCIDKISLNQAHLIYFGDVQVRSLQVLHP